MAVSIAKVRQAAAQLRNCNKDVTLVNIQKMLAVTENELQSKLRVTGLREELGIVSTFDAIRIRYKGAADSIKSRNEPVTINSLVREMNLNRGAVSMWVKRNKVHASALGIVSMGEARRLKRASEYKNAVEGLRIGNQLVTKAAIAQCTSYDSELVYRDFKRNSSLAELLLPATKITESA